MSNQPLLILRLEGLMQSWGERARWDNRDTNAFPSKSGIIGLIACAMGLSRGDTAIRELEQEMTIGVRADRPGIFMTDFQTIKGEFVNAKGEYQSKSVISYRQYLFDASFSVILAAPENVLQSIASALKKPKWQIYLGRKNCVPSRPVFEDFTQAYSSIDEALRTIPLTMRADKSQVHLCELEDPTGSYTRRDRPFITPSRLYQMRRLAKYSVIVPEEVKQ